MNRDDDRTLLLVSGDFSGIQDTVYTISSKGALKSLRARSFMLELLTEHIVYEILQLAEMTESCWNVCWSRKRQYNSIMKRSARSHGGMICWKKKQQTGLGRIR